MQTGTLDVTVTVTNVNEPADISFAASGGVTVTDNALSVDENYDDTLATFSASDPEMVAGLTYVWSVGGTDGSDFAVISEFRVLSFAAIPDYELPADSGTNNVYDITVNALDSEGETGRLAVTVTVTNENERPVVKRRSGTGAFSIVENSGTDVGRFVATDPEGQGRDVVARDHRRPWPLRDRRERRAQPQGSARLRKLRPRPRPRQGLHRHRAGYRGGRRRRADARADGRPRRDRHHHQRERAAGGQADWQRHGPLQHRREQRDGRGQPSSPRTRRGRA